MPDAVNFEKIDVPLDRDIFMRSLIRELAGTLEDVVGLADAAGFVSIVGATIGEEIDKSYRRALKVDRLSRDQVAAVLVDLKRRIAGQFYVIEESDDRIVLGNKACPFGDRVIGRHSVCMMTSNVFGSIAAENLGYSKVELQRTIANGDEQCRVVIYLRPDADARLADGREYFSTS